MSVFHDEVEIEDFAYEEETGTYSCPCPCGVRILNRRGSTTHCPEEAALASVWELARAAGDPSAELHELRKHGCSIRLKRPSNGLVTDWLTQREKCCHCVSLRQ